MKLIVGLGNPGEKYTNTRHNIGFLVLDELKNKISNYQFPNSEAGQAPHISNESQHLEFKLNKKLKSLVCIYLQPTTYNLQPIILAKPTNFMNSSGDAVRKLANYYKLHANDVYVVHDDLDIRLGEYKIQKGKGPKDHKGLQSIEAALGTNNFWRVRVGVDNRTMNDKLGLALRAEQRTKGEEYVLQDFTGEEKKILDKVTDKLLINLINLISK